MMRGRDVAISFACALIAGILLIAAGEQLDSINGQREAMGLAINAPLENAPPTLAFATVAMGAFRGLVVDILWIRADRLKDEGQFFDARQLAEWITLLQPRFATVWEFQAWNMAYNISVAIPASQPEQRWQWVKNGFELLRDKGIPLNPKSLSLCRELGRIFQHKIGGISDDAHEYYKLQMVEALEPLLQSQDNGLGRESNEFYDALIRAPATWSEIQGDPNVAPLIEALRLADDTFARADGKEFVANYLSLRQNPQRFKPEALKTIEAFRTSTAIKRFDIFAKAYQLRHEWKLDPTLMQQVNRTYGPIDFRDPNHHFPMDWRNADSHAIYWAVKALQVEAGNQGRKISMDETNVDRIVIHSLQNLFRSGKITVLQQPEAPAAEEETAVGPVQPRMRKDIFLTPDLRMFDAYDKAALAVIRKNVEAGEKESGPLGSLRTGHKNMLKNAVMSFYQAGIKGYALLIYNELRKLYPDVQEFRGSLDEYVEFRFNDELSGLAIHDATEMIIAMLMEGYFRLAIGDDDTAAARERLAQDVHRYYMYKYEDPTYRIDLPKMPMLKYIALGQFLNNDMYPAYVREGLLARIKTERPELYKQMEQTDAELRKQMEQSQGTQG
ncbi:MAG: hypothetical protein JW955_07915 [Sedimentisphaerales bacterium]|nr:hypothetical protein [Sedimentisphaerales bacterium]